MSAKRVKGARKGPEPRDHVATPSELAADAVRQLMARGFEDEVHVTLLRDSTQVVISLDAVTLDAVNALYALKGIDRALQAEAFANATERRRQIVADWTGDASVCTCGHTGDCKVGQETRRSGHEGLGARKG